MKKKNLFKKILISSYLSLFVIINVIVPNNDNTKKIEKFKTIMPITKYSSSETKNSSYSLKIVEIIQNIF